MIENNHGRWVQVALGMWIPAVLALLFASCSSRVARISGWPNPAEVRLAMSGSKSLAELTRSEWESLGFFYDYDDSNGTWLVRAHRRGMERLCEELRRYASDPRNAKISEHEHYGPYSYLKFVTWTEPKVVADGIYGRVEDFDRLARIIATAIVSASPGDRIRINEAYATANEARLELVLEPDSFDVASADPSLVTGTG